MTYRVSFLLLGAFAISGLVAKGAVLSVSGSVVDDAGIAVAGAELLISNALPASAVKFAIPLVVTGPVVQRVTADSNGNFSVSGIASGPYVVCAEAPSQVLLDPCHWGTSAPTFTAVDGHAVAGLKVVMARGATLTIQVKDPLSLLKPVTGPIDFNCEVQVLTSKGLP